MPRGATTPGACKRKVAYASLEEAQTHLDLLKITQPHGGAHAYICNVCQQVHLSGDPGHVPEPRWKKRRRRKARRRHDEDQSERPVFTGRNLFVGELAEVMGIDPHASTLFDAHVARGRNMAREIALDENEVIAGPEPTPATQDPAATRIGHLGDFTWAAAERIEVDLTYQRDLSPLKVNKIAEGFDADVFGVVYLAQRGDGALMALDGQHRVAAVVLKFGGDKEVPAYVLSHLSPQDEARIYYKMNRDRLSPTAYDGWRARVAFGDEVAVGIKNLLDAHGIVVKGGLTTAGLRFNELQAIHAAEEIFRAGDLPIILDLIDEAWMGVPGAHRAVYMRGIQAFVATFRSELTGDDVPARVRAGRRTRLVDTLALLGTTGLDRRAKFYQESINARTPVAMARAIHWRFNSGLKGGGLRLPQWGEDIDAERDDAE
jgi:hypothetical protein